MLDLVLPSSLAVCGMFLEDGRQNTPDSPTKIPTAMSVFDVVCSNSYAEVDRATLPPEQWLVETVSPLGTSLRSVTTAGLRKSWGRSGIAMVPSHHKDTDMMIMAPGSLHAPWDQTVLVFSRLGEHRNKAIIAILTELTLFHPLAEKEVVIVGKFKGNLGYEYSILQENGFSSVSERLGDDQSRGPSSTCMDIWISSNLRASAVQLFWAGGWRYPALGAMIHKKK